MSSSTNDELSGWRISVILVVLVSVAALAVSCSGERSEAGTDRPADATVPTTVEAQPDPRPPPRSLGAELDDEFLAGALQGVAVPEGAAVLFAVVDSDGGIAQAALGSDADGRAPTASDPFRVGSITKVFTAVTVLTFVDDGVIDLDDPAVDHVTRFEVPAGVTVRDLLRHRSGIYNVTDLPGHFDQVMEIPGRVWTPEERLDLIADRGPRFEPGSRFGYSNTNYLVLGVLIEEATGLGYHEVVRARILDPIGMRSTYLDGFEDGPAPFDPYDGNVFGVNGSSDYTSIATAAWAAGGMVSSAPDLHRLFSALYDGSILSEGSLAEMTAGDQYGLGVELSGWADGLLGHGGAIPGYNTLVRYSVDADVTAFFARTYPNINPRSQILTVVDALAALA